jgi:membrane protease YdiL (CAAX protease family)
MGSKRLSAWVVLGVMAFVFLGGQVAGAVVALPFAAMPGGLSNPLFMFVAYTVAVTLSVVAGALWLGRRGELRLRFGIDWSAAPMILLGVVAMFAMSVVIEPLVLAFPRSWLDKIDRLVGTGGWAILTVVVAAPVLEEIFCRGLLLETLSHRWRPWAAVLASAAFFGIVHLNLPQVVNAFALAVVMGYLYLATRSLIPVIVIHAINNALSYLQREYFGTQTVSTREMVGDDFLYLAIYAASAGTVIATVIALDRRARTKTAENSLQPKTTDTNEGKQ